MSKRAAGPTAGSAAKKARAPSTPGLPALKKELDMLDKKQLLEMLLELAKEAGVEAVRKLAPPADLGKIIKELNQKVNAVSTAMGRYSNGDAFCWKKAKGKNGSARTALVAAANKFRSTREDTKMKRTKATNHSNLHLRLVSHAVTLHFLAKEKLQLQF